MSGEEKNVQLQKSNGGRIGGLGHFGSLDWEIGKKTFFLVGNASGTLEFVGPLLDDTSKHTPELIFSAACGFLSHNRMFKIKFGETKKEGTPNKCRESAESQ